MRRQTVLAALLAALIGCSSPEVSYLAPPATATPTADAAEGPVSFTSQIWPLINRSDGPSSYGCRRCHDPSQPDPQGYQQTGLDLSSLGTLRRGGRSTGKRIVIPGNPDASAIVQKVEGTYAIGARMPKDRAPWSVDEIALLRRWIQEGAHGEDSE
jgi:hypothetical protein